MADQEGTLDLGDANLYGKPRRVEQGVIRATAAAELGDLDAAGVALARELARACDVASVRQDPYGVATAGRELRECLIRLKLDPTARGETADAFAQWLDSLDGDTDAPVSH